MTRGGLPSRGIGGQLTNTGSEEGLALEPIDSKVKIVWAEYSALPAKPLGRDEPRIFSYDDIRIYYW